MRNAAVVASKKMLLDRDTPFDWPAEVQDAIFEFGKRRVAIEEERLAFLREQAEALGYRAVSLDTLRSSRGHRFIEQETGGGLPGSDRDSYRRAVEEDAERHDREVAYYCGYRSLVSGEEDGCGWVRGTPQVSVHNSLGEAPLAGWRGREYACKLCGMHLGCSVDMIS